MCGVGEEGGVERTASRAGGEVSGARCGTGGKQGGEGGDAVEKEVMFGVRWSSAVWVTPGSSPALV